LIFTVVLVVACSPTPIPVTVVPTPTVIPTPEHAVLTRGPYLQSVTPESVVVIWETEAPASGTLAYGETSSYGQLTTSSQVGTRHVVTLTGLSPYTTYHYRVQTNVLPISQDYVFRTAAAPGQDRFRFVAFGDTRSQPPEHQAVVDLIVGMQPDFVLHTGDMVAHGSSPEEWQIFFAIEQELMARAPLFPVLGNHEGMAALYFDLFHLPGNERWYSFDYGPVHFVALQADNIADLSPEGEQMRWLRADLEATDRPWKLAFFHVPPYSSLQREGDDERVRLVLATLLEQYGVQLVFNGHDHSYQRLEVDGITYVVTGGGGAPLYSLGTLHPALVAHAVDYHALLVTVHGSRLTAVAVSAEGEELDRFTLELP
jgi:predicted phosphodiesterase